MALKTQIPFGSPPDLSKILELAGAGDSLDLSSLSDEEIIEVVAKYLAFTFLVNEAVDRERKNGRCFIYCPNCLKLQLLDCPDEKAPSEWTSFQHPPETAYAHKECLAAS